MKHEYDVSDMVGCVQVVRIYSYMKEIKLDTCAMYVVFFFVKTENNFIKKQIIHVLRGFIVKVCENSRAGENPASRVFNDLLSNSPKRSPRFSPGYEATENKLYFLHEKKNNKVIQIVNVFFFIEIV